jgi:hypothetical protein
MAEQAQFSVGSVVFVPDEQAAYLPKRVVACKGLGAATQLTVGPVSGDGPSESVPKDKLGLVVDADPLSLEGADDMVKFTSLTEGALLHNLRTRYSRDAIYSAAGAILISVNPFKELKNVYTAEAQQRCRVSRADAPLSGCCLRPARALPAAAAAAAALRSKPALSAFVHDRSLPPLPSTPSPTLLHAAPPLRRRRTPSRSRSCPPTCTSYPRWPSAGCCTSRSSRPSSSRESLEPERRKRPRPASST